MTKIERVYVALLLVLFVGVLASCGEDEEKEFTIADEVLTDVGGRGGTGISGGGGGTTTGDAGMDDEDDVGLGDSRDLNANDGFILPAVGNRPMVAITGCAPGNTCTSRVSVLNRGDGELPVTLTFEGNGAYQVTGTSCSRTIGPDEACTIDILLNGMPTVPKVCLGQVVLNHEINGFSRFYVCAEHDFNNCRSNPCP